MAWANWSGGPQKVPPKVIIKLPNAVSPLRPGGPSAWQPSAAPVAPVVPILSPKELETQRRQEEAKKKRAEAELKRKSHTAALQVRKVVQRVRIATPETLDELRAELDTVMTDNLEAMGDLAEKVQEEAEKGLLQGQQRVDEIMFKREEEERKKAEEELKKQEAQERADMLAKEAREAVEGAEEKLLSAEKDSEPLALPVNPEAAQSVEVLINAAQLTEASLQSSSEAIDQASRAVKDRWGELGKADDQVKKLGAEFRSFHDKLAGLRKRLTKLKESAKIGGERASRREAVERRAREHKEAFDKYDLDGDGRLNREEIAAYAQGVLSVELSEEPLNRIMRSLGRDGGGVPPELCRLLYARVAIEKSVLDARESRAAEEEQKKAREEEVIKKRQEVMERKNAIKEAEAHEQAERKRFADMESLRAEVVLAMHAHMSGKGSTREEMFTEASGGGDLDAARFATFLAELKDLQLEAGKAAGIFEHVSCGEASISQERFLEFTQLFYSCIKPTVLTEGVSIKSKAKRRVELGEILEVHEGPCKEEGSELSRLRCTCITDSLQGWATIKGTAGTPFLQPAASLMYCVKETALTDSISVEASNTVRPIARGEFFEVLEFAKKDETGSRRARGRTRTDGVIGWVTIGGNLGTTYTTFLEPC